jgi:hypothetical protein
MTTTAEHHITALLVSYGLIWVIVLLEGCFVRALVQETAKMKRSLVRCAVGTDFGGLPRHRRAPRFALPVLDSTNVLTTHALRGRAVTLLFVSPGEAKAAAYRALTASVHALWHRANGQLYVICSGEEKSCRHLGATYWPEAHRTELSIALDVDGTVRRLFQIVSTPHAVTLDRDARVIKNARPLAGEAPLDIGVLQPALGISDE